MEQPEGQSQTWIFPTSIRRPMKDAYWTHCLYCHHRICGVEVLDDYPDVVVLYAHRTCHSERRWGVFPFFRSGF